MWSQSVCLEAHDSFHICYCIFVAGSTDDINKQSPPDTTVLIGILFMQAYQYYPAFYSYWIDHCHMTIVTSPTTSCVFISKSDWCFL